MKKLLFVSVAFIAFIGLASWGWMGHRTVATIADNHLTFKAKAGVQMLLGDTAITEVGSWADEVLGTPAYKSTAPWHYVNAPLGMTLSQFKSYVIDIKTPNLYQALQNSISTLKDKSSSNESRAQALKFVIHFVGDAHQPMHVSREEDKGGNTIQVQFDGKGTNLHTLWDSKLINKQGYTVDKMVVDYDKATDKQVKQWQKDDVMTWLFESYQISSKLYAEVEKKNKLDDKYYIEHMPIVQQRIEMAGIRLAGILNDVFKDLDVKVKLVVLPPPPITNKPVPEAPQADLDMVKNLIGQEVKTQGMVYGMKDIGSMVLVDLGAAYPNQKLTIALKGSAKSLAKSLDKQTISVTGKVIEYRGKPEIVVIDEKQIVIIPIVGDNKHRAPSGG